MKDYANLVQIWPAASHKCTITGRQRLAMPKAVPTPRAYRAAGERVARVLQSRCDRRAGPLCGIAIKRGTIRPHAERSAHPGRIGRHRIRGGSLQRQHMGDKSPSPAQLSHMRSRTATLSLPANSIPPNPRNIFKNTGPCSKIWNRFWTIQIHRTSGQKHIAYPAIRKLTPKGRRPPTCVYPCFKSQSWTINCSTGIGSPYR